MRHLAIDFGEKRIGLAYSDAKEVVATPIRSIKRQNDEQAITEILQVCAERNSEVVIVGMPYGRDLRVTDQTKRVKNFINKLTTALKIPVRIWNETGTTEEVIHENPDTKDVDAEAACLILQDYLDRSSKRKNLYCLLFS